MGIAVNEYATVVGLCMNIHVYVMHLSCEWLVHSSVLIFCFVFDRIPGICSFNDTWLADAQFKQWVARDLKNHHKAVCTICQKSFSIKAMGKAGLISHPDGKKHKQLLSLKAAKGQPNITEFLGNDYDVPPSVATTSVSSYVSAKSELNAEILWILNVIEKHYSFRSCCNATDEFKQMFPDSEIVARFSLHHYHQSVFVAIFTTSDLPRYLHSLYTTITYL